MSPRYIIVLIAAFGSCYWTQAAKYIIEFTNDDPIEPCDENGFTFIEEQVDLSKFKFYRDDNDDLMLAGSFKFKKDVGTLQMIMEGKRQERGNWVQVMSLVKDDFCKFLTVSGEAGADFLNRMTPKDCPIKVDVEYTVEPTLIKFEYESAYKQGQGDVVFSIKLLNKEKNIATCFRIFTEVH